MSSQRDSTGKGTERSLLESYVFDVHIRQLATDEDPRYRFEAPNHEGRTFDDPDTARLYADVYFDVNGFEEAGTGERGIPPEIVQAGRDTLAAYLLTQPGVDVHWVGSFFGKKPAVIERYAGSVRSRAAEIRTKVRERGLD